MAKCMLCVCALRNRKDSGVQSRESTPSVVDETPEKERLDDVDVTQQSFTESSAKQRANAAANGRCKRNIENCEAVNTEPGATKDKIKANRGSQSNGSAVDKESHQLLALSPERSRRLPSLSPIQVRTSPLHHSLFKANCSALFTVLLLISSISRHLVYIAIMRFALRIFFSAHMFYYIIICQL